MRAAFRSLVAACVALAGFVAVAPPAMATVNARANWTVRTTGSDNNGGGSRMGGQLAAPSTPAISTSKAGGTVAAGTYYGLACYSSPLNEGPSSPVQSVVTSGTTSTITVASPAASPFAYTYSVYFSTSATGPFFLASTGNLIGTNYTRTTTPATSGTQAPGVDYTDQDGPQVNIDNSVITTSVATTTITFTGGTFTPTAALVGNFLQVLTGTNMTAGQVVEITGWTSTTLTVDRNIPSSGTTTNMTAKIGGAFATLARLDTAAGNGHWAWVRSGTYAETFALTAQLFVFGYQTTRGDSPTNDNRPLIDGGGARTNCITWAGGNGTILAYVRAANATSTGIALSGGTQLVWVRSSGHGGDAIKTTVGTVVCSFCEAASSANGFSGTGMWATYCWAHDDSGIGFDGLPVCQFCVSSQNASHGFLTNTNGYVLNGCTSYGDTGASTDGFNLNSYGLVYNCIASSCGRYGFNCLSNGYISIGDFDFNCYYANATGLNNIAPGRHDITSDPLLVDPGNATAALRNFALQRGSPAREAGATVAPGSATSGVRDLGAVQNRWGTMRSR